MINFTKIWVMTVRPIHPNWISKDGFIRGIGMLATTVKGRHNRI